MVKESLGGLSGSHEKRSNKRKNPTVELIETMGKNFSREVLEYIKYLVVTEPEKMRKIDATSLKEEIQDYFFGDNKSIKLGADLENFINKELKNFFKERKKWDWSAYVRKCKRESILLKRDREEDKKIEAQYKRTDPDMFNHINKFTTHYPVSLGLPEDDNHVSDNFLDS